MDWTRIKNVNDLIVQANYNYTAPNNITLLIYDFYFLSWVSHLNISPKHEDINLENFAQHALNTPVTSLKQYLIDHLLWKSGRDIFLHTSDIIETAETYIDEDPMEYNDEIKEAVAFARELCVTLSMDPASLFSWYSDTYEYFTEDDPTFEEVSTIANILMPIINKYKVGSFSSGADLWAEIYKSMLTLQKATNINDTVLAIDHIIDLAHNNGSILEYILPLDEFDSSTILDDKAEISDISLYINKVSPSLKPFAKKVVYNVTGKSEEFRRSI